MPRATIPSIWNGFFVVSIQLSTFHVCMLQCPVYDGVLLWVNIEWMYVSFANLALISIFHHTNIMNFLSNISICFGISNSLPVYRKVQQGKKRLKLVYIRIELECLRFVFVCWLRLVCGRQAAFTKSYEWMNVLNGMDVCFFFFSIGSRMAYSLVDLFAHLTLYHCRVHMSTGFVCMCVYVIALSLCLFRAHSIPSSFVLIII